MHSAQERLASLIRSAKTFQNAAVAAALLSTISSSTNLVFAHYAPEEDQDQDRSTTSYTRHRWDRWNTDWDRKWRRNWNNSWGSTDNDVPVRRYYVNTCNKHVQTSEASGCTQAICTPGRDIPNFHEVHTFLFRGGQPTEHGLERLKDMGVLTIVDLRSDPQQVESERQLCEHHDLRFVNIPLIKTAAPSNQDVSRFMDIVGTARENPDKGAVFVHDHLGADRTGCAVAMYRVLADKYPFARAYDEMLQYGFHSTYVKMKSAVQKFDTNAKATSPKPNSHPQTPQHKQAIRHVQVHSTASAAHDRTQGR